MTANKIHTYYQIDNDIIALAEQIEHELSGRFKEIDLVKANNFYKVLYAMQQHKLADHHFGWQSGYGYNDAGREVVEAIYATIFKGQAALVRPQIVNGTHALSLGLTGILRPGDQMLSISGKPYDTLHETIGLTGANGSSLMEIGVTYDDVELLTDGQIDIETVLTKLNPATKLIYLQRSSGYSFRPALTCNAIQAAIATIKEIAPSCHVMVDNCYGEFIEDVEPLELGANLIAGSLIKNPGGGLALTGGYLVGDHELVERAAKKLTAPGIAGECGLTFGQNRTVLQGLFQAPDIVSNALKGALFSARLFAASGYRVVPDSSAARGDIIQAILLGDREKVIRFCQAIQAAAPVDSFVEPEPWEMPGYDDPVIMAAGAFVQGSSIELSADAPMRPPYAVYLQGGLSYEHAKLGAMMALQTVGPRK